MKKHHLLLYAFLLTAMTAWADDNNWHFAINADGTATVICYEHPGKVWINGMEIETLVTDNCYRGDAEIPSVTPEGITVTGIGSNCFYNCSALTSVKIPNTIKRIGDTAFRYCHKLKEITIPSSVEEMGDNAICSCDSIERLIIEDSPNTLELPSGYTMFRSLYSLRYIYQGRNMVSLDTWKQVFRSLGGPVEVIEQGPMVTQMIEGEFENNDSLKTIRLSPNVTVIPKGAFDSCESLETVEAGAVTSIGENAFSYCYALKATPDLSHCKEILGGAFSRCKSIERVVIPASVDTLGYSAFSDNEALTELVIEDCDRPLKVGSSGMFRDSDSHIKKAYFGRNAESTEYLQYGIIENNPSVEEITFAGSCSYLRSSEFAGCYALKTVRLGKNMKDIPRNAFGWSSEPLEQLTTLICEAVTPPECVDGALQAINKEKCTLHVPVGCLDAYREANEWKDFFNIIDDIGIYYDIYTAEGWQDFANGINDGSIDPTTSVRLTNDIDLGDMQVMVGTVEHPFQGVFDGQGHTLTVNLNSYLTFDMGAVAPFSCVKDATIKNLHVAGNLIQQYCAAGGVVGQIRGNLTVSKCWVSAYMYVQGYGSLQGTIGGIASYCDDPDVRDCKILIEDCLFSGELGTGIHSGTIMSHVNGYYGNHATLRNCLSVGVLPEASGQTGTFIRPIQGESFDIINCFYKDAFGAVQGTQATAEQLANRDIAFALQAGRPEYVWVQDLDWEMPMLLVFSRNPDPDRIDSPRMATEDEAVYDLSGRRLGSKPSKPGLYILGGKKTAVK